MHIKIPTSVQRALAREAAKMDRYPTYLVRNILIGWERDLRTKRAQKPEEGNGSGLDIPTPPGFVTRRKRG